MRRAFEEEPAFACVARERSGALELPAGFVMSAEPGEKVAAHARQEVIAAERGLESQFINKRKPGFWTKGHRDCHCAVQINDGRRQNPSEFRVKRRNRVPNPCPQLQVHAHGKRRSQPEEHRDHERSPSFSARASPARPRRMRS